MRFFFLTFILVSFFLNSAMANNNEYRTLLTLSPDMVSSKGRAGRIFKQELVPKYTALSAVMITLRTQATFLNRNGANPEIERKVRELNNKLARYGQALYLTMIKEHPGKKARQRLQEALEKLEEDITALSRELAELTEQAANKNGQDNAPVNVNSDDHETRELEYGNPAGFDTIHPAQPKQKCKIDNNGKKICVELDGDIQSNGGVQ